MGSSGSERLTNQARDDEAEWGDGGDQEVWTAPPGSDASELAGQGLSFAGSGRG